MAGITKSVSGTVTTYTVTDQYANTATVTVTTNNTGNAATISTSAALREDGMNQLAQLLLQLATQQVP